MLIWNRYTSDWNKRYIGTIDKWDTFSIPITPPNFVEGEYIIDIYLYKDRGIEWLPFPPPEHVIDNVGWSFTITRPSASPQPQTDPSRAISHCQQLGGSYQNGVCYFSDGSSCDAIAFLNGQCMPSSVQSKINCLNQGGLPTKDGQCLTPNQIYPFSMCQSLGGSYQNGLCRFSDGTYCGDNDLITNACAINRASTMPQPTYCCGAGCPPGSVCNQPQPQPQPSDLPFRVTTGTYSETSNLDQSVKFEFGNDYRVADWNDIKAYSADIQSWANSIGMKHNDYYFVTWNGQGFWQGTNRHYFITRFDGQVDLNYLVHDQIGGNIITLGSWYGIQERVLAIRDTNQLPTMPPVNSRLNNL